MSPRRGLNAVTQNGGPRAAPAPSLSAFCPKYHQTVELIGKRWNGAVLRLLITGPHRFNEILAGVPGLSDRLLSERMRQLEGAELVVRTVFPGPPIRSEYDLTERGRDLEPVVREISAWADRWIELPAALDEGLPH